MSIGRTETKVHAFEASAFACPFHACILGTSRSTCPSRTLMDKRPLSRKGRGMEYSVSRTRASRLPFSFFGHRSTDNHL